MLSPQCHPDSLPAAKYRRPLAHASCNLSTLHLPDKITGLEAGSNLCRSPQGLRERSPLTGVLSSGPVECCRISN